MNLNATLFGQMITFTIFIWFCMKFVWPYIVKAMEERETKIADGLAAAERGQHDLELAQHRISKQFREAKVKASDIIVQAQQRSNQIIEEAQQRAREEGDRLIAVAHTEIEQERQRAKQKLRRDTVDLAIYGAEKILERDIDDAAHAQMFDKLIAEIDD